MSSGDTQRTRNAKATFFRQSGWMMMAAVGSGVFMFAVHPLSKKIPDSEYGVLGTLLAILTCISIPTLGLQSVIAQQTAASVHAKDHRQLTGTVRTLVVALFGLWVVIAGLVLLFQQPILSTLKIAHPAALWITLCVGLMMLWLPITFGLLQGLQNFFWLGCASILNGATRFFVAAIIVLFLHQFFLYGQAAGVMTGALAGFAIALALSGWHSRAAWSGPAEPIEWRNWLGRVAPLTLGLGASQFQFSADQIVVQSFFPEDATGPYVAAGTLCRALVTFTAPLVQVMFPKIVRSVAREEKTDVLGLTVIGTALLGGVAATFLTLAAPMLLPFVFKSHYTSVALLVAWFSWSMVPLAMANVLINNLLARQRYRVVPWLVLVAAGYACALSLWHDSFLTVVKVLGTFNLLMLFVAIFFNWRQKKAPQT